MRLTIWTILAVFAAMSLTACDQGGLDMEAVTATSEEAISYVDDELGAQAMQRDTDLLSDERLIEEAEAAAQYAVDHGCDVKGVLGGVWLDADESLHGRWFKLDRSLGGDLDGLYLPDEIEDGGTIEGDWESSDGLVGTLGGDYYAFGEGEGYYLGTYEETDGDAAGLLGGLWYRNGEDGGVFFGVWGHCGAGVEDVEPESY